MNIRLGTGGEARIHVIEQDDKTIKIRLYFQDDERNWYRVVARVEKDKLKRN